jgi:hypothetical protein
MARSSIDFGIKKIILKGKGEINLSASAIFNKYGLEQEIASAYFTSKIIPALPRDNIVHFRYCSEKRWKRRLNILI